MAHFTYDETVDTNCLKQGDLLSKTDELSKIIEEVHPHFGREEYKYFLVTTQTCDLYRSDKREIKTKYINIAAVRTFEEILKREAAKISSGYLENKIPKLFDEQKQNLLYDFVSKLLNNNHPDYFYLHGDIVISDPLVAVLRVSIALKAIEHYDICVNSKVLELENSFKAKLGWLIGNLYSRVSTEDWESYQITKPDIDFNKMINEILRKNFWFVKNIKAIESELLKTQTRDQLDGITTEDLIKAVNSVQIKSKKQLFDEKIFEVIKLSADIIPDGNNRKTLYSKIVSDRAIMDLFG